LPLTAAPHGLAALTGRIADGLLELQDAVLEYSENAVLDGVVLLKQYSQK
jgi:hypothetical protein